MTSGTVSPREASREHLRSQLLLMAVAFAATLPGLFTRFTGYHPPWKAGDDPDQYAPLALANMTGANRLLIGVGWSWP